MPRLTFVDTSVLIRACQGAPGVCEPAQAILGDPDRIFVASDVLALELLPKAKFNGDPRVEFFEDYLNSTVATRRTETGDLQDAYALATQLGLNGFDALLLLAAIQLGVDEFVTAEAPTKPFFRLKHPTTRVVSIHV